MLWSTNRDSAILEIQVLLVYLVLGVLCNHSLRFDVIKFKLVLSVGQKRERVTNGLFLKH
jgi:hypothetical protein